MNTTVCARACLLLARAGFKVILVSSDDLRLRKFGIEPDVERVTRDRLVFNSGGQTILLHRGGRSPDAMRGHSADYVIVDDVELSTDECATLKSCARFGPLHFVRTV